MCSVPQCVFSHWLFLAPWTVAFQATLSMGFPRQEYWSGLPFPSSGHLPNPGIKPASPALAGGFFTSSTTFGKPYIWLTKRKNYYKSIFFFASLISTYTVVYPCSFLPVTTSCQKLFPKIAVKKKYTCSYLYVPLFTLNVEYYCHSPSCCSLFSPLVMSNSLKRYGLQHTRLPCPSQTPRVCLNSCPLSPWCHPSHPLLHPSPPACNLYQHQGLFQWVGFSHQVAKILELQL